MKRSGAPCRCWASSLTTRFSPRRCSRCLVAVFTVLVLLTACVPRLPRVIKIGLVAPFEGRYRYVGYDAIYAARMAVQEINAAGGAGGWYLEVVAYDDRADPSMARVAARNLITDPDVVAVIGHYGQRNTQAAAELYATAGLPWIVVGGRITFPTTTLRHLAPAPDVVAAAMLEPLADASLQTLTTWGDDALTGDLAAHSAALGYRYVPDSVLLSPTEFPDAVLSTLEPLAAAERLVAWRDQGWQGILVGDWNLAAADFGTVAGAAVSGTLFVTPYPYPQNVPEATQWVDRYLSSGPHVPQPGPYALPTYETVYLLAEAVTAASRSGIRPARDSLASLLPDTRHEGLLGTVAWGERGFWQDAPCYLYRWQDDGQIQQFRVLP